MIVKAIRLKLFFIFFLITSNSNSLVMIDSTMNPIHKQEIVKDLQNATGLWLDVRKDFIRELPTSIGWMSFTLSTTRRMSPTARYLLEGALNSESVYRIRANGSATLARSGSGIDLNFDQLGTITYRNVPREAFGAGIILLHELAHIHRGLLDPELAQGKANPDIQGPTVEFINRIQSELGLPERLHYFPKKIAGKSNILCIYFGDVERVEIDARLF